MATSYANPYVVASATADARAAFIRRTYTHLAGAIAVFAGLSYLLIQSGMAVKFSGMVAGKNWLFVMGAFMAASWLADRWARSDTSVAKQYLGLGLFTVAWAVMSMPLLSYAVSFDPGAIGKAGVITLLLVVALTAVVFTTRKDFSFLGSILKIAGIIAVGTIVASIMFDWDILGTVFSGLMILFAAGSILYTTSNILHHYNTSQHVAASLALFSGVALLFWYVLRFVMSMTRGD